MIYGLTAFAGGGSITLIWSNPNKTTFAVYLVVGNSRVVLGTTNSNMYKVKGLPTTDLVTLAISPNGFIDSDKITMKPLEKTPTPSNIKYSGDGYLSWDAVPGVDTYVIYYSKEYQGDLVEVARVYTTKIQCSSFMNIDAVGFVTVSAYSDVSESESDPSPILMVYNDFITYDKSETASVNVVAPILSKPSDTYNGLQVVELRNKSSYRVVTYTVDGTEPTKDSTVLVGDLIIGFSCILKLRAFDSSDIENFSDVSTYEYVIINSGSRVFYPIISIVEQDSNLSVLSHSRYKNTKQLVDVSGFAVLESQSDNIVKSSIEDTFYTVDSTTENRLDLVAYKHYSNTFLWWVIAEINKIKDPFDVPVGTILVIPGVNSVYGAGGVLVG